MKRLYGERFYSKKMETQRVEGLIKCLLEHRKEGVTEKRRALLKNDFFNRASGMLKGPCLDIYYLGNRKIGFRNP